MSQVKISRAQVTELLNIFSYSDIKPESDCQKMALGIVEDRVMIPLRRKLLSQANSFTLKLKDYEKIALLQYLQSLQTQDSYEWVQIYKLTDSIMR